MGGFLFDSIQTVKGFPRKFPIADDVPKTNWATIIDVEVVGETAAQQLSEAVSVLSVALSNISHNSLLGVNPNNHHNKIHSETHAGSGSDALQLPFEFKNEGSTVLKIDTSGNIYIKGRILRL